MQETHSKKDSLEKSEKSATFFLEIQTQCIFPPDNMVNRGSASFKRQGPHWGQLLFQRGQIKLTMKLNAHLSSGVMQENLWDTKVRKVI